MPSPRLTSPLEFYNILDAHRAASRMMQEDGLDRRIKAITVGQVTKYRIELMPAQPVLQAA
ncbi:hypothetical protein [Azospirillum sp. Sh1]|uniref:hypothetical protein n=1 Tax=Azospirillum sp. Sh1 TaxID=2607285 RepID=UPI0011EBF124|nr:hypothetical protein [Azospirillum sp. Sh1]KAA0573453.1 hypothetical protein FZ029_20970 [Azospirillum sp. Sh1]